MFLNKREKVGSGGWAADKGTEVATDGGKKRAREQKSEVGVR